MAGYRQLHSRMWSSDQWFAGLEPDFKLLFIYLFSNERASVSGLYEIPVRVIAFETGLDQAVIRSGFDAFAVARKVSYDAEKGVVWVHNMIKYQGSASPKVKNRMIADVNSVPECDLKKAWLSSNSLLIGYQYSIDTDEEGIDTSSSISIYSSISSSSSMEGGGTGEETKPSIPQTPAEADCHPDIQLYRNISGRFPGNRDYRTIIETVQLLRQKHGSNLESYLSPFWTAWSSRKTKEQKPYSPSSLVWLCEWAMQGDIPKANGHEPQRGELTMDKKAIIRKVARNAARN